MRAMRKHFLALGMLVFFCACMGGTADAAAYTGDHVAQSGDHLSLSGDLVITTGNGGHAILLAEGGTITMTEGSLTNDKNAANVGAATAVAGSITMTDVDIATTGTAGFNQGGIWAEGTGVVTMSGGSITTQNYTAHAVQSIGNAVVKLKDVDITTYGNSAYGILNSMSADLTMEGGSITINGATDGSDNGAVMQYGGTVALDGITISTSGNRWHGVFLNDAYGYAPYLKAFGVSVDTTGNNAYGIVAQGVSTLEFEGGSIMTSGANSYGAYATSGSLVRIADSVIATEGTGAYGAYVYKAEMEIADSAITTSRDATHGVYVYDADASITGGSITTNGAGSYGVNVFASASSQNSSADIKDTAIKTTNGDAHGLHVSAYTTLSMSGGSIHTTGTGAKGAEVRGTLELSDFDVTTEGVLAHGIAAGPRGTVILKQGGSIDVRDTSGNTYALYAAAGISSNIDAQDGVYSIKGDIFNEGTGKIDVSYLGGSVFTGGTAIASTGSIDFKMANDALWNMTKNSVLTGLEMSAAGANPTVDMTQDGGAFGTLTTGALSGSGGNFIMDADIPTEQADNLIVTGTTAGSHILTVANDAAAVTTGEELTTLVQTADQQGEFSLAHSVEAGAYLYDLRSVADGAGQYWELYATGSSNPGSGGVNTFIGTYYLTYAEQDTLMKRLGDLRGDLQHSKSGAWFRGFGGKMESDGRSYAGAFDMDYWGVQIGYDRLLDRDRSWLKNGDSYVGAFIGYSEGDLDLQQVSYGKGDLENHTMGMYWTYVHDTGFYFDAIAKYVWSRNEYNVRDSADTLVQGGRINTGGVGMSLETGKRFRFRSGDGRRPAEKGNWYVEPQAQLSWQHLGGGTYHADNGLRIGVGGFDSLIGRLGILLGYESAKTNVYAKVSYLKEFDGEMRVNANDVIIHEFLDDAWWVYGIGVTHLMNPRNALYLDLERSSGGDFEDTWRVNAGWRISF